MLEESGSPVHLTLMGTTVTLKDPTIDEAGGEAAAAGGMHLLVRRWLPPGPGRRHPRHTPVKYPPPPKRVSTIRHGSMAFSFQLASLACSLVLLEALDSTVCATERLGALSRRQRFGRLIKQALTELARSYGLLFWIMSSVS